MKNEFQSQNYCKEYFNNLYSNKETSLMLNI